MDCIVREWAGNGRRGEAVLVLVFAAVSTLVMYRAGVDSLASTLPWNLGDPALNTWILSWEWHALVTDPTRLLEGNIFHPFGDALKYSELMLPLVPLFGTISSISGNPVLALNLTTLALSVMSIVATYLLARRFVGKLAALLSAVAFSFSGFVFMHQSHLQLLTLGLFPLSFLALFRMLELRRIADGVWLGICSALLATGSFYYGAIWITCMGAILALDAIRLHGRGKDWWSAVAVAAVVCALLLAPIAIVYAQFQSQVSFARDTAGFGLRPLDMLTPAPGSLLYSGLFGWAATRRVAGAVEHGFFMGFVIPVLAVMGWALLVVRCSTRRQPTEPSRAALREMWWMILAGIVALSIAVGPELFGIPLPLHFLRAYVPGFDAMRAVSRLAVPALLTASLLAAWALDRLTRGMGGTRIVVSLAVIVVVMLELHVTPIRVDVPEPLPISGALAQAGEGAVVELPMRDVFDPEFALIEGPRLLSSLGDWRPRFNGYSGDVPSGYMDYVKTLNRFPAPAALAAATELDLRYVVLHAGAGRTDFSFTFAEMHATLGRIPAHATVERYEDAWLVDLRPDG